MISVFENLPLVRGYSPDGELRWTAHVTDFRPLSWVERVRDVGQTFGVDSKRPGDLVLSLTSIPDRAVLVQIARLGGATEERPGRQRIERLDSYLLSADMGEGVSVGANLPRILHADRERLWAVEQNSVGVLAILQLRYRHE